MLLPLFGYEMGEFKFGRSNYEIAELTWQNGQPEIRPPPAIWEGRTGETLESIVQQATWKNFSGEKWAGSPAAGEVEKDAAVEWSSETLSKKGSNCMESDDTTTCWANSFDSTPSFNKVLSYEDSVSLGGSEMENEVGDTKTETVRSGSSRRSRAAAIHNQSERRRRERINQKMKALQKLVPNASKTDKASMLDEVIEYLKQLQAQVQLMSNCNNARFMMQQYQLQLALLSRMDNSTAPFLSPPFLFPSSIVPPHASPSQSMNMEMYKKMAQAYLQQVNQGTTNH